MLNPNTVRYRTSLQRLQRGGHWVLISGHRSFWSDARPTPWMAFMRSQIGLTGAMISDPSRHPVP
jgi:hypothetical protein